MKKVIIGSVAVGAVVALRPVLKRRMVQKMREHCQRMMGQFGGGSETAATMRCRNAMEECPSENTPRQVLREG